MFVSITATFDPDSDQIDSEDATGLTEEAYESLMDRLIRMGFEDIDITKVG